MTQRPFTVLCLASYEKGEDLLRALKQAECKVILVTVEKLKDSEFWPREYIDELHWMPDIAVQPDITHAISYLARSQKIHCIIALDEFDIEIAAALREHLRIPGMGDTTARYFRDKLAMRVHAKDAGIRVPAFSPVINYDDLRDFMAQVPAPWVLKPRTSASAIGIKKIHNSEELWRTLDEIGDEQSFKVLEKYIPGEIFHVDAVIADRTVQFAQVHKYGAPPMDVMHQGGLFTTRSLPRGCDDEIALQALNQELIKAFGFVHGVTHTEFIKGSEDGQFYFLETAARVGGAYIAEVVKAATGLNLWEEWARVEMAQGLGKPYQLPVLTEQYAGIILSLARQEWPDTSDYNDPEIVYRVHKKHHAGLVLASADAARVQSLLDNYSNRFYQDFYASAPVPDKPTA